MALVAQVDRSADRKPARDRLFAARFTRISRVAAALARPGRLAAALACVALAAGCSSSSSTSTPAATTTVTVTSSAPAASASASASSAATSPTACATSALKITQSSPNGYAGGVIVTLVFTNTSSTSCTLYGYPGVSFLSSAQKQIGLAAKRSGTSAPKLVTLDPSGGTASATLQIVDALNFPATTCSPVKAAYLKIYPPNQTASVMVANTSQTCSKPVQTLTINPVVTGSGGSE
jgi:Domain of unknown function (DUF4232)